MNDQNNNQGRDLGAKEATSLPRLCAGSWGEQELFSEQNRKSWQGQSSGLGLCKIQSGADKSSYLNFSFDRKLGFKVVSVSPIYHKKCDFKKSL